MLFALRLRRFCDESLHWKSASADIQLSKIHGSLYLLTASLISFTPFYSITMRAGNIPLSTLCHSISGSCSNFGPSVRRFSNRLCNTACTVYHFRRELSEHVYSRHLLLLTQQPFFIEGSASHCCLFSSRSVVPVKLLSGCGDLTSSPPPQFVSCK